MKILYTCITGNYDRLVDPLVVNPSWRYICYTNSKYLKSDIWEIVSIEDVPVEDRKLCRLYKTNPHKYLPGHDISIYIDGNMQIKMDPEEILRNHYEDQYDMVMIKHDHRFCVYDEAEACIRMNKDSADTINRQMEAYRSEKFPKGLGLPASGVMIRKPGKALNALMEKWFSEISKHSNRDQLSFDYVLWKTIDKPSIKYISVKDRGTFINLAVGHPKP